MEPSPRLRNEIQPKVNIPRASVSVIQSLQANEERTRNDFAASVRIEEQTRRKDRRDDREILNIEHLKVGHATHDDSNEIRTIGPGNDEGRKNKKRRSLINNFLGIKDNKDMLLVRKTKNTSTVQIEDNIEIRRVNSDPNAFFRFPVVVKELSSSTTSTCFKPLHMIVERIMMLNIAAFILLIVLAIISFLRLFLYFAEVNCEPPEVVFPSMLTLITLLVLYVLIIKKKLSKTF